MKLLLNLLFVCCLFSVGMAQDSAGTPGSSPSANPVTNKDISDMLRAGVAPDVILAKMKTSICRFDTSPSALVSLKESGVPDAVLMEMVRNPNGAPPPEAPKPVATPQPTPAAKEERTSFNDDLPEYGDLSEIRRLRRVFVIADDIDSQNLLIRALQSYEGLQVVGSPETAQVFVAFAQGSSATGVVFRGLFPGTIDYRTKAQFLVFYRGETGRKRIVWQETEDIQTSSGLSFSRPNEINVARHFIKALRKVRGELE